MSDDGASVQWMMFAVSVANRTTGKESTLTLEARDARHAKAMAVEQDWLVSNVTAISESSHPPMA